jgi:hypothetical protein
MELTDEEWHQVEKWLIDLRVHCDLEQKTKKHVPIQSFYSEKSLKIKDFLDSKRR